MNNQQIGNQAINFLLAVAAQIVLFRNIAIFDFAFCFVYVGFILFIPINTNRIVVMSLGFLLGFINDIFYDTLGMHAAACVLMAYSRNYLLDVLSPSGGYEANTSPSIKDLGFRWFATYALLLILIHHLMLLLVEASNWSLAFRTILQAIASTIFTFAVLVSVQYIFRKRSR